ncbi:hypothetical protein [Actinoplanes xinjiangensis]|uniref:hypothetical protein n=1 Tax=Actinoplanes xinjiangensis TaxID=512350 RepID=UPI00343CC47B
METDFARERVADGGMVSRRSGWWIAWRRGGPVRRVSAAVVVAGALLISALLIARGLSRVDTVGREAIAIGAVAGLSAWAAVGHLMWRFERRRERRSRREHARPQ